MANISPERFAALRKQSGRTQDQMGDLLGISGKYVGMIERGEKPIEEQSSLGLLFRAYEASGGGEDSRDAAGQREGAPVFRGKEAKGESSNRLPEMPAGGNYAIAGKSSVREKRTEVYESLMTSLSADSAALATHLLKMLPREEVFKLLRDLTKAGEGGDESALRKARALLEILPVTHPTTTVAGG
jgi:transcriptional regulator with XRE-family HTH domain